jgi:carbon starvation protein
MDTLLVAAAAFAGFIVAYHTYGRFLARKIFQLDDKHEVPSQQLRDDIDYVPTRKQVIFGHHFTSIAGTGPIVGPAIAVFWGWLPALLWVVLGSIFIGAVHDFGALVVSLRNRGQTVGEVAGRLISPRARLLFLLILFFSLTIVLAIFGLVIAFIFAKYPESVLSVWVAMPVAILLGLYVHRRGANLLLPSLLALGILYAAVYWGVYYWQPQLDVANPVVVWTAILMVYCFIASVLPVWLLLQPRDYVNSHQLIVALLLLVAGLAVAGWTGSAQLAASAPAVATNLPTNAPPIWPFLFITIACGACSGFHCLVSSGTSSKQVACETDAQYVAYGSMLLEGALAVLVILSCCAGLGIGVTANGETLTGREAWLTRYDPTSDWAAFGLGPKVSAFVDGGANFVAALGIPEELAVGIIAVLVACFAATTLDTATRLQRYVIQELGNTVKIAVLRNKYVATGCAVSLGMAVAMIPADGKGYGTGGLILWPLFGATNQLLAGLAFLVTVFYLWRRSKPILLFALPMLMMLVMPTWALLWQMFNTHNGWFLQKNYLLLGFGGVILLLQAWMVIEAVLIWPTAKGVLEEALPPLKPAVT